MTDIQTPYPIPLAKESRQGLWPFSQRLYSEPGVETLCLHLQDTQNINVLLLLWCSWLEMRQQFISSAELAEALERIAAHSEPTVARLREVRRFIKGHDLLPVPVEKQVREQILSVELAIEKQLLLELEALSESSRSQSNPRGKAAKMLPLDRLVEDWGLVAAGEWLGALRHAAHRVYTNDGQ